MEETVWCRAFSVPGFPSPIKIQRRTPDPDPGPVWTKDVIRAQSSMHCDYFGTSSPCTSGLTHLVDPTLLLRPCPWQAGLVRWRAWALTKPGLPARDQTVGPVVQALIPETWKAWPELPPAQSVLAAVQNFVLDEIPVGLEGAEMTQGLFLTVNLLFVSH